MDMVDSDSELKTSQSTVSNDNYHHLLENDYITEVFGDLNLNENVTCTDRHTDTVADHLRRMNAVRRRLFDSCSSSDESASKVIEKKIPILRKRTQKSSTSMTPEWKKRRLQIFEQRRKKKQRELKKSKSVTFCQKEVKNNRKIIYETKQESSDSE